MKKIFTVFIVFFLLIVSITDVYAQEDNNENYLDTNSLYEDLSEESITYLENLNVKQGDINSIQDVTLASFFNTIVTILSSEGAGVLPSLTAVIAILMLYALFSSVFVNVTSSSLNSILSVVSALCISVVIVMPVVSLVNSVVEVIKSASDFMLSYIPIMCTVLVASGKSITAGGYSSMMVVAASVVSQICAKVVTPLLSAFMALGVSSSIVADIDLQGIMNFLSKGIKYIFSLSVTLFTGFLSIKTMYSGAVDSTSTRAVRYTLSSFIPVVGGALSEAYKSVRSGVGVLKQGVGVFAILAVFVAFLPIVARLLIWIISVNLCKTFAQVADLKCPVNILSSVGMVLSILLSVTLCIASLYIITTSILIGTGNSA